MTDHDDHAYWLRVPSLECTCLDEDYELGWAIDPNGDTWPAIFDTDLTGRTPVLFGAPILAAAPHEALGRLPAEYRERLGLRHRCGRPTSTTGRPCRTIVEHHGEACTWHQ
jgi:hypothetical protein